MASFGRIIWGMALAGGLAGCDARPTPAPVPAVPTVKVVSAKWGSPGTPVDVTKIAQDHFDAGTMLAANNGPLAMKADPAPGRRKVMELTVQVGDKTMVIFLPEDGQITVK